MERRRDRGRGRRGDAAKGRKAMFYFACFLLIFATSCSRRNPEAEKRAAVDEFFANARSCVPANEPEGKLRLAIAEVANQPLATHVHLVAYATDEAVDFHLPVYRLSSGKWLINEQGRAYLLDERCREFKLKGREPSSGFHGGRQVPLDGRIRLSPGQAFETTLIFPRLLDQTRIGVLVYDGRVLPFTLPAEAQ